MKAPTVVEFFQQFPNDEVCLKHLFDTRFGQDYVCPKCERQSGWFRIEADRAWSCGNCGHHVHPTAGTIFEATRTPLQSWFYAIYLFTVTRHGVSGKELQRQLGVTYKTAWRMGHKIREHMANTDGDFMLSGHVEIDESYFGGKASNMHADKKEVKVKGRGTVGKTVMFGMVERGGNLHTEVVPNARRVTLQPIILDTVEEGSEVSTDEMLTYANLNTKGYIHGAVHHAAGEYVNGDTHTNTIESYWGYLKRSINSTHISVRPKYLQAYSKEFEYRWNRRQKPEMMFSELISSFEA